MHTPNQFRGDFEAEWLTVIQERSCSQALESAVRTAMNGPPACAPSRNQPQSDQATLKLKPCIPLPHHGRPASRRHPIFISLSLLPSSLLNTGDLSFLFPGGIRALCIAAFDSTTTSTHPTPSAALRAWLSSDLTTTPSALLTSPSESSGTWRAHF